MRAEDAGSAGSTTEPDEEGDRTDGRDDQAAGDQVPDEPHG